MAAKGPYEIVCVETKRAGCHITHVGTRRRAGKAPKRWTVKEVRKAIKKDIVFYTEGEGDRATVERYKCGACGAKTIRSEADPTKADNLDKLPGCGAVKS